MPDNENLEVVSDEPQYEYVTDPMMLDSTGQEIVDKLDDVKTAVTGLGTTLATDKANRDASNVTNASAWRSAIGAAAQTQVGSGSFKISEHYTATTSQYGSINISSIIGKSINQCSIFNVLAYSSAYQDGLFCYLTFVGTNYFIIVRNVNNTLVTNTPVELYVNYYTV